MAIKHKEIRFTTNPSPLCKTYSTLGLCLKQTETDIVYSSSVIDVIAGYTEDGKPYSRFHYVETDIPDTEPEEAEEADNG